MSEFIELQGVQTHNLKDIDVQIPKNAFTVITGVSGSGKSSLAFTSLCAEWQRRYLESLSTYARMFVGWMKEEAKIREIKGISPTISIDQKTVSHNPRSTVGTITEIYDFLRLLFLHVGVQECPTCGKILEKKSKEDILDFLWNLPPKEKYLILAPIENDFDSAQLLRDFIASQGFVRYMVGNTVYSLSDDLPNLTNQDPVYIVVDRMVAGNEGDAQVRTRLLDSIDLALKKGEDKMGVFTYSNESVELFSLQANCPECDYNPPTLTLGSFSFNSHHGACQSCHGLGNKVVFLEEDIVNPNLTLAQGALLPWDTQGYYYFLLTRVCQKHDIDMDTPYKNLTNTQKKKILHGVPGNFEFSYKSKTLDRKWNAKYLGIIPILEKKYHDGLEDGKTSQIDKIKEFSSWSTCPTCDGYRLNSDALHSKIASTHIGQVADMNVQHAIKFLSNLELSPSQESIAKKVLKNALDRLRFLEGVGLSYITISRQSNTLSGGESQRIRLATQIGSELEGITYVLDEPSIGLHPRDNNLLINNLRKLVDIGNTLVVVEHDEDIMRASDHVIDIGPGAGVYGGDIVFSGPTQDMLISDTETAQYLSGKKQVILPTNKRKAQKFLTLKNAHANNLKNVTVKFPVGMFTVVTGVSGSGKSSLVNKTLSPFLLNSLNRARKHTEKWVELEGVENFDKTIVIDQKPIGKTPRSNPATYTNMFTYIREVFAQTVEAKKRGYTAGHFSFNTRDGRCNFCDGDGVKKVEMHFLPDVYVECEHCKGTRYNNQVKEVQYKGKNIAEVLKMTIDEAYDFFEKIPRLQRILQTLLDVGLGYLQLGQSATTLSGGESQRVKLATELSKRSTSKTIYILDEPTTGLHFSDVQRLLGILDRLVDKGNTVLVIEHNLDVIGQADWIVDIGPEWGDKGWELVFSGTKKDFLTSNKKSHTKRELQKFIDSRPTWK